MPACAVPSDTPSTGAGRPTSDEPGGRDWRAARSDDARALRIASLRNSISDAPATPERGGLLRAGGLGEIVLACLDLWEDAASDVAAQLEAVGVQVRLLTAGSDPELDAAVTQQAHAFIWWWGADLPDPGGGVLDAILRGNPWLYRDQQLEALLGSRGRAPRPGERLRTYREFERIWIGEQAAVVPLAYDDRQLWRRPWVTGMWLNAVAMSTFADAVVQRPHVTNPSELRCAERMRDTRLAASPPARFRTATCLRRAERLRSLIQALWAGIPGSQKFLRHGRDSPSSVVQVWRSE